MKRRRVGLMARSAVRLAVAGLFAAACGEYAITNPFDTRVAVELTLNGPDTTYSIRQRLAFTVESSRPLPGARPEWTSSGGALESLGNGLFVVRSASYQDTVVTVTVSVGTRSASRIVHVRQRAARIVMTGQGTAAPSDSTLAPALGVRVPLALAVFDSAGYPIAMPWNGTPPNLAVAGRDTTVVAQGADGTLYARAEGTTYVVASIDGRRDSIVTRVRQLPANAGWSWLTVSAGDSVKIVPGPWVDSNMNTLTTAPVVLGYRSVPLYEIQPAPVTTVDAAGWVHTSPGVTGTDVVEVHWATADGQYEGWAQTAYVEVDW